MDRPRQGDSSARNMEGQIIGIACGSVGHERRGRTQQHLVTSIIIDDISDHLHIFGLNHLGDTNKHKKQTFIYKRRINNFTLTYYVKH